MPAAGSPGTARAWPARLVVTCTARQGRWQRAGGSTVAEVRPGPALRWQGRARASLRRGPGPPGPLMEAASASRACSRTGIGPRRSRAAAAGHSGSPRVTPGKVARGPPSPPSLSEPPSLRSLRVSEPEARASTKDPGLSLAFGTLQKATNSEKKTMVGPPHGSGHKTLIMVRMASLELPRRHRLSLG